MPPEWATAYSGNLTRDPELRYTPSGQPVVKFGIAVNRNYLNRNGERVESTDFFTVNAWRSLAENGLLVPQDRSPGARLGAPPDPELGGQRRAAHRRRDRGGGSRRLAAVGDRGDHQGRQARSQRRGRRPGRGDASAGLTHPAAPGSLRDSVECWRLPFLHTALGGE